MKKFEVNKEDMKTAVDAKVTQQLFIEVGYNTDLAVFTLQDDDREYKGKYLYSLKRLYMEIGDSTEYEFAMTCFCNWQHWLRVRDNKAVRTALAKCGYPNGFDDWVDELEVKQRSEGIRAVQDIASNETGAKAFQAAKYVAEAGWKKRKAGAPSKEEKVRQAKIEAGVTRSVDDDAERLGIH